MTFAKTVFLIAGIFGVLVVPPLYFMESQISKDFPPAITHPEFFYGFIGVGLAWQIAFLIMSKDPGRYRPIIPAAVVEKFSFGIGIILLFAQQRVPALYLVFGFADLTLGCLFIAAFYKTRPAASSDQTN